jgi:hypothetical protein
VVSIGGDMDIFKKVEIGAAAITFGAILGVSLANMLHTHRAHIRN